LTAEIFDVWSRETDAKGRSTLNWMHLPKKPGFSESAGENEGLSQKTRFLATRAARNF
jgi:hypothetical protein